MELANMREFVFRYVRDTLLESELPGDLTDYLIELARTDLVADRIGETIDDSPALTETESRLTDALLREVAIKSACDGTCFPPCDDCTKRAYDPQSGASVTAKVDSASPRPTGFPPKDMEIRARILGVLTQRKEPITCKEVAIALGRRSDTTNMMLKTMIGEGTVAEHTGGKARLFSAVGVPATMPTAEEPDLSLTQKTRDARLLLLGAWEKGKVVDGPFRSRIAELIGAKSPGQVARFISGVQEEWRQARGIDGNGKMTKRATVDEIASEERHEWGIEALAEILSGEE